MAIQTAAVDPARHQIPQEAKPLIVGVAHHLGDGVVTRCS
jgi:hypothetical protein